MDVAYTTSVNCMMPAGIHLPKYTAQTRFVAPSDVRAGPFQSVYNTQETTFEYLIAHPPLGEQFNHHMAGCRLGQPTWMDKGFYPVGDRLLDGMDDFSDAALLVDIGGGVGHDLQSFTYVSAHGPTSIQSV